MECSWHDSESGLFSLGSLNLPRLLAIASPSMAASPSVNLTNFSSSVLYARMTALGSTIVNEELGKVSTHLMFPALKVPTGHTFASQSQPRT